MEDSAFQQVDGVGLLGDLHIMGDEDDAPPLFMLMAQEVHDDVPVFGCHKLWKCLALLNELLDKDSWLMRKIRSWWR